MSCRFKCVVEVSDLYVTEVEAENASEARHTAHEEYMEGDWKGRRIRVVEVMKLKEEKHEQ